MQLHTKILIGICLFVLVGIAIGQTNRAQGPKVPKMSDMHVDKLRAYQEDAGYIRLVGQIENNGNVPAGVEIKIVIYDKDGGIVTVSDQWPASIKNIPAKGRWPFETLVGPVGDWEKYSVQIIDVRTW